MFCSKCGKENNNKATYCKECGAQLVGEVLTEEEKILKQDMKEAKRKTPSLVCGIVSIVLSICSLMIELFIRWNANEIPIAFLVNLIAFILAIVGASLKTKDNYRVCSIVACVIASTMFGVLLFWGFGLAMAYGAD